MHSNFSLTKPQKMSRFLYHIFDYVPAYNLSGNRVPLKCSLGVR